jgi:hypothetical protein
MSTSRPASLQGLSKAGARRLQKLLRAGEAPDIPGLVGWEYHGVNMPATLPKLLGIRRFIKGFEAGPEGGVAGYNQQVVGSAFDLPWTPRRQRDGRDRYAPFAVRPVAPDGCDSRYPRAVLFDYGAAPEPEPGLARRLRDYVVRVVPGSDELLLGRAYLTVGSRRIPVGWFAIERAHPIGG